MNLLSSKRAVSLLVALILAAAATVLLVGYVRALERQVESEGDPVRVWVATDRITAGTRGSDALDEGLLVEETVPRRAVADGAITDPAEISERFANADIFAGQQIVLGRFSEDARERLLTIPPDRQAMAVEVASPTGVAGFVQKGDRVSILSKAATEAGSAVGYIVQDVEVLEVGRRGERGPDAVLGSGPGDGITLTLALTAAEAEQVAFAAFEGALYFTLLPDGQGAQETPGRTAQNLFS